MHNVVFLHPNLLPARSLLTHSPPKYSIGFTVPVLPKIINMLINDGDPKVSFTSLFLYSPARL